MGRSGVVIVVSDEELLIAPSEESSVLVPWLQLF